MTLMMLTSGKLNINLNKTHGVYYRRPVVTVFKRSIQSVVYDR